MNEIKMSTNIREGRKPYLAMKMNVEDLGVDWSQGDVIRVLANKKANMLTLKRVNVKSAKTIAHRLTKTGGGNFSNDLGIYMSHGARRFQGEFADVQSVSAACRKVGPDRIEVHVPRELFTV